MYCKYCGNLINEGDYCSFCGKKQSGGTSAPAPAPVADNQGMNGTTVFLISMLVALVCMIFFGILISAIIMIVVTVLLMATKPAGGDDRTIPSIIGSVAGLAIGYLLNMLYLMALVL